MNIKTAIEKYENNTLTELDVFFDWFCKDSQLKAKTKKLMKIVVKLSKFFSNEFMMNNLEFNNHMTISNSLYDSISITNKDSYILFKIVPERENVTNLMKFVNKDVNLEYLDVKNMNDIFEYFKNNNV